MFSHVMIGAQDLSRAARFYDAVLAPLGITRFWGDEAQGLVGWRRDAGGGHFFVGRPVNGEPSSAGNGSMCAFTAANRDQVHQSYAAALAQGGTDEGPPGPRPQYSPEYFGAYFRDPEGNKLHVVYRGP